VSNHDIADDGDLRITPTSSPPGLAITGEINESTYGDLAAALGRLTAGPGEIHVDLAGVEYCDLVGLRAIVGVTGANGQDP
jgi:anti-anti-sigma regulatory factor